MEGGEAITILGLGIADLTAMLMMGCTLIATVANVLLWFSTRQTVQLLLGQIQHQLASGYSEAQRNIVDAHRDLFFQILNNPPLLERFAKANELNLTDWELQKVSSFLVNQVMISFLNFQNGIISFSHFDGFKRDAQNVFAYKTVRSHWENVRLLHSEEFRRFVEAELLWRDE
jgi:hypothetical protein